MKVQYSKLLRNGHVVIPRELRERSLTWYFGLVLRLRFSSKAGRFCYMQSRSVSLTPFPEALVPLLSALYVSASIAMSTRTS